nr:hypothetical protein [Tanacetum cinerariifolium]
APLTTLVKPGGGIHPIAGGTVWRRLISMVNVVMIGHLLDGYLKDLRFGVRVSGEGEAILYVVNRLFEDRGDNVDLSMLLVDFKNAFNLVYREIRDSFILSFHAWYLDDGAIIGDTLVVGNVLEIIMQDGPRHGLHLNVNKTKVFWPKEDPISRVVGVFPPNISLPMYVVKLLYDTTSVDLDFSSELALRRVARSIELIDVVTKLNDPQCELLLLRACTCIFKFYFAIRTVIAIDTNWMVDFVPDHVVIKAAQRKRVKYEAKSESSPWLKILVHVLLFIFLVELALLLLDECGPVLVNIMNF